MRTSLNAIARLATTKGATKRLRREGRIPVTVSARGDVSLHYTVSLKELTDVIHHAGTSALIELKAEGEKDSCLVISRDLQYDAISNKLIHVGFQKLSATEATIAEIRIVLVNEPSDALNGNGTLEHEATFVQVRATPDKLPSHIDVDTSGMVLNSVIHAGDLPTNPNYEIVTPADTVITVLRPTKAELAKVEAVVTEEPAA